VPWSESRFSAVGICGDAAAPPGGMAHHPRTHAMDEAMSTCWVRPRRHGPRLVTAGDDVGRQGTCRRWLRRQAQTARYTCRLPRRAPPKGGLFNKKFRRWSFLIIHSHRWYFSSKIPKKCVSEFFKIDFFYIGKAPPIISLFFNSFTSNELSIFIIGGQWPFAK
jgi:hypothetical protein